MVMNGAPQALCLAGLLVVLLPGCGGGGRSAMVVDSPAEPSSTAEGIPAAARRRPLAGTSVTQSSNRAATDAVAVQVALRPGGDVDYRIENDSEWSVASDDAGTRTVANVRGASAASGLTVTAVVAFTGTNRPAGTSAGALTEGTGVAFHTDIEDAADPDYLVWGSWTSVPRDATAPQDVRHGAFATGSDPFRQEQLARVIGAARYRGDVKGVYFSPDAPPLGGYSFAALATLEVDFGDGGALGTIDGRLENFLFQVSDQGDYLSRPLVAVTLEPAEIGTTSSGFFSGATTGSFEDGRTTLSGRWGGRFYGNANGGGAPGAVAGTFGAASVDDARGLIGAFGAHRE